MKCDVIGHIIQWKITVEQNTNSLFVRSFFAEIIQATYTHGTLLLKLSSKERKE